MSVESSSRRPNRRLQATHSHYALVRGVTVGGSMRHTEPTSSKVIETFARYGTGVPVVGLPMGGIYSMPAMRLCNGREAWLSALLSIALAITVFGLGYLGETPILYSVGGWGFPVVLLLVARRLYGTIDGKLERFGLVHATALLTAFALVAFTAHGISRNA